MGNPRSDKLRMLVMLAGLLGGAVPVLATPRIAFAQSEDDREEAKRLFAQGSTAFLAKRYTEALESLRVSYRLVASPNSGLLIARCLRELNRPVEAVTMYDSVALDARRHAAEGDTKYAQTADVAASLPWSTMVRSISSAPSRYFVSSPPPPRQSSRPVLPFSASAPAPPIRTLSAELPIN